MMKPEISHSVTARTNDYCCQILLIDMTLYRKRLVGYQAWQKGCDSWKDHEQNPHDNQSSQEL